MTVAKGFTCKQCGGAMGRPHIWCAKCKRDAIEQAKRMAEL